MKLEDELSKQEILEGYLNTVYFGRGPTASRPPPAPTSVGTWRSSRWPTPPTSLGCSAPEQADAERNPEEAYARRRSVLDAMLEEGYINAEQHEAVDNTQWNINPFGLGNLLPRTEVDTLGNVRGAQYGTEYVMEYVRQELVEMFNGDEAFVYGGGLRVYTTMRHDMQEAAYQTVTQTLNQQGDPEASIVAVGPEGVLAMMGGRDFGASQVNLAVGADGGGSGRQPGSSFKPFARPRRSPRATQLRRVSRARLRVARHRRRRALAGQRRRPRGGHTLLSGTAASSSVFFAQLMLRLGTANVLDMAQRLGIRSELPRCRPSCWAPARYRCSTWHPRSAPSGIMDSTTSR